MKDILNNLFKSLWYAANLGVNANYKPEHFLKYLYISNLGLFTFVFIIEAIKIQFYLAYAFILGLSYLCCTGKSNFWKMLLGTFFHFNLLLCILYLYSAIRLLNGPLSSTDLFSILFVLYTLLTIVYFIFNHLSPYIVKVYSNSFLGLNLKIKKLKLRKLKRELKAKIKELDE